MMAVTILVGDALERLTEMPDESVHCVVTSPPYWGLRDYGVVAAIGLEPTFDEHVEALTGVFREVRRVLRRDGTLWLNYGDAYAGGGRGGNPADSPHRKQATKSGGLVSPSPLPNGLKPKDLLMMPARVALALQQPFLECRSCGHVAHSAQWGRFPNGRRICPGCEKSKGWNIETPGWWLRSEIIWHKPNPMPESVRDRPSCAHEKLFLLTRSRRYFYDAAAVRTPLTEPNRDRKARAREAHKSMPTTERNGIRPRADKQRGHSRRHAGFDDRWDAMSREEQQAGGANLRNVWTIATHPFSGAHFATFPPKLVEPCIKAGTSEKGCCTECGAPWQRKTVTQYVKSPGHAEGSVCGRKDGSSPSRWDGKPRVAAQVETVGWSPTCDCTELEPVPCTVLDPFAGAGTTGLVADRLGRDAVLIEVNPEYAEIARRRIEDDAPLFTEVTA